MTVHVVLDCIGSFWWPSGKDSKLSLLWPGSVSGRGAEIPQVMRCGYMITTVIIKLYV